MVLMRNDAFEKREQILKLRMKVLKVEQERMDGVNTPVSYTHLIMG